MSGGDLLNLLIEQDTFTEDSTRFYLVEVWASFLARDGMLTSHSTRWYWQLSHVIRLVSSIGTSNRM